MSRDVVVLDDPSAVADTVARRFLARMAVAQARGESPQVALTGGTVAGLIHRRIAELAGSASVPVVDWDRVGFWWGDERFVPADSEDRNARQAHRDLLDPIGAERVHPIPAMSAATPDVAAAARVYEERLRSELPHLFDLVMLGMGPDGHVASLFPGFEQLAERDLLAVPVTGSPKPPPERVSLTFPMINHARAVWFLVTGQEKAAATARAWAYAGSVAETPARGVSGPSVTWFIDSAAAGA